MDTFEAEISLRFTLRRNSVLYVEHKFNNDKKRSIGRYYAITNTGSEVVDITEEVAYATHNQDNFTLINNPKTGRDVRCISVAHPDTLIRNLSSSLYGNWYAVPVYILEKERVF